MSTTNAVRSAGPSTGRGTPTCRPRSTRRGTTDSGFWSGRLGSARRVALALAGALALVGCSTLPSSGPVTPVEAAAGNAGQVYPVAFGPSQDATPEQIVEGFVLAMAAGAGDEFSLAREYLDGPVARTWDPRAQVRVYAAGDDVAYMEAEDGSVRAEVLAAASVDADGRYTEAAPGTQIELDFSLMRNADGQWRIVDLDDGILLSPAVFDAQYDAHALYFLSTDREVLVPELRWFPERYASTLIVRNLLAGPSPWLAPGVVTAFPEGTTLTDEGVSVVENVATIDLTSEVLSSVSLDQALMIAQLTESLRAVRSVGAVNVTSVGVELSADQAYPALVRNLYVPASPTVIAEGELRRIVGPELVAVDGVGSLAGIDARHPALPLEENGRAVILDGTDRLVTVPEAGGVPELLYEGFRLTAPSIDRQGWAWTASRGSASEVVAVEGDEVVSVAAPWLAEREPISLRVSRDGARALVAWAEEGRSVIGIASVVRDVTGRPIRLADPVLIGEGIAGVADVTWVDELTVAVLGTQIDDGSASVHLLTIGGARSVLPSVPGAIDIAAATGDLTLVVATADGDLFTRTGLGWSVAAVGVAYPTFQG